MHLKSEDEHVAKYIQADSKHIIQILWWEGICQKTVFKQESMFTNVLMPMQRALCVSNQCIVDRPLLLSLIYELIYYRWDELFYASRASRYAARIWGQLAKAVSELGKFMKTDAPTEYCSIRVWHVCIVICANVVYCTPTCRIREDGDWRRLSMTNNKSYSSSKIIWIPAHELLFSSLESLSQ